MRLPRTLVSLCALAALTACGGGGGGGGTTTPTPPAGFNAGVNVSGPWKITATTTASSGDTSATFADGSKVCDPVGEVEEERVTLAFDGTTLTVTEAGEPTRSAGFNGRSITLTYSLDVEDFRGAITDTWNFAADGNSLTGTSTAVVNRISTGAEVCRETVSLAGARDTGPAPIDVAGAFVGTNATTASTGAPCEPVGPAGPDNWNITQSGSSVTWDADDPQASLTGTLNGLVFTATKTFTANGQSIVGTRNVTFSADGSSFSGTDTFSIAATGCSQTDTINGTRGTPITISPIMYIGSNQTTASDGPPCQPVQTTADSDTWDIVQNGFKLTWDSGDEELEGTLTGTNFVGSREFESGGAQFRVDRNVTFSPDGSSFSGTDTITSIGLFACQQTDTILGVANNGIINPIVSGDWTGTSQITASSGAPCPPIQAMSEADTWTIQQNGSGLAWDLGETLVITGGLNGTMFVGAGTATVGMETYQVTRNVVFSADGMSFSGTDTVVGSPSGCTFTETISGTRGGATVIDVANSFTGSSQITASSGPPCPPVQTIAEVDDWSITQNGTSLTWDPVDGPVVTGTLTGSQFVGTGTATEGGNTFSISRNVTFAADGQSFSGSDTVTGPGCSFTVQIAGANPLNALIVRVRWGLSGLGGAPADLDLGLQEPGGAIAAYNMPSAIGGAFSGDQGCGPANTVREEQWVYPAPPSGSWNIRLTLFGNCGTAQTIGYELSWKPPGQSSPTFSFDAFTPTDAPGTVRTVPLAF